MSTRYSLYVNGDERHRWTGDPPRIGPARGRG